MASGDSLSVFDIQAEVGMTKHLGGRAVTEELLTRCQVDADSFVLDVGCGAGASLRQIVGERGARAIAMDIRMRMAQRARERAQRIGYAERVVFVVADAQALPFGSDSCDAVMTESVLTFLAEPAAALREFRRVTRPGGWVGVSESTWPEEPSEELRRFLHESMGSDTTLYTASDWRRMLGEVGLEEVTGQSQTLDLRQEAVHQIGRYTLSGILRGTWRALKLLARRPKDYLALTRAGSTTARQFASEMGYGVWVGRVPQD